jgi:tetratricopeptide (TPR) repeat protein
VERVVHALSAEAALPAILSLAALLRMAHGVALMSSPFFAGLELDHRYYDQWALGLAHGDSTASSGVFFVDPLYAYFLAAIYRVLGHNLLWPRVAQLLLGVATCLLVARIARRVLGSVARGNLAALAYALFVPAIFYEGEIEKTALGVFLFTLALALFLRREPRARLASGLALGAAILARGNLLVFAFLGAGFLLVEAYRARDRRARDFVPAALFGLGALGVILPVTVHNYRAEHELVLTTANFGQNLYLGQNHENASGSYEAPSFVRPDPAYEESDFRAEAERRSARSFSASSASAYWAAEARSEMAAAPGETLARTFRKFRLFWHQFETPDSENIELVADYSWVLGLPLLGFGWLTPFALLGALTLTPKNRDARLLACVVLVYTGAVLSFFVLARFRAPLVPVLCVFAAAGVVWLERQYQIGARRAFLAGVLLCGAALAFTTIYPAALADKRKSSLAIAYHNLASSLEEHGDLDGAIHLHERAIKVDDAAVPASLRELGEIYLQRADYARAERVMQRVLELKPDSAMAKGALARLHAAMGHPDGAPPAPSTTPTAAPALPSGADSARAAELRQKAQAFRNAGEWDQAIDTLQQAIAVGAYDENLHYALGSWMEAHATPASMISYWSKDAKTDPKPQTAHYYWAVGLERSGDDSGALQQLAQALEIDPAHELSELRIAQILERQAKHSEALAHCQTATRIFPDLRMGHEFCAKILRSLGRAAEAERELALAQSSDPNTPRRFVYWARYLAQKGRTAAAVKELENALAANANDAEARALLEQLAPRVADAGAAPSAPSAVAGALSDLDAQTLRARLSAAPAGTPVWFVVSSDPSAAELSRGLSAAFRAAGFRVAAETPARFPLKPGIYLFSAEDQPESYVETVRAALQAIGKVPTVGLGYRAYYEDKLKTNPAYQGFAFAADQTYLIAIGPQR